MQSGAQHSPRASARWPAALTTPCPRRPARRSAEMLQHAVEAITRIRYEERQAREAEQQRQQQEGALGSSVATVECEPERLLEGLQLVLVGEPPARPHA